MGTLFLTPFCNFAADKLGINSCVINSDKVITVNPRIKPQGKTKMSINFSDRWNLKMAKLNLPKNSPTIEVCYQSKNGSLYTNLICLKKIQTFLFYPGFLCECLR